MTCKHKWEVVSIHFEERTAEDVATLACQKCKKFKLKYYERISDE